MVSAMMAVMIAVGLDVPGSVSAGGLEAGSRSIPAELKIPNHIAIIMDGNGRWATMKFSQNQSSEAPGCGERSSTSPSPPVQAATKNSLLRVRGHRESGNRVLEIVEKAAELGVKELSLFAFGRDNWKRPEAEVSNLMDLFSEMLLHRDLQGKLEKRNIRMRVVGAMNWKGWALEPDERVSAELIGKGPLSASNLAKLQQEIKIAEAYSANNTGMKLNILIDYSGSWELEQAMRKYAAETMRKWVQDSFASGAIPKNVADLEHRLDEHLADFFRAKSDDLKLRHLVQDYFIVNTDVDLLIRTGGEERISDFLPFQCRYAEFVWSKTLFPEFTTTDLIAAIEAFSRRQRRFGKTSEQVTRLDEHERDKPASMPY
eukprot:gnl/TRDRNA2_/TRDRNA2_165691_c0_seq1.p1 gnl/TRDRNA2_/TRDRNA2_165691_c0~~gnl/TRDRNA2_/TRDRNA2_165691_c0_seq1.p1  ORF type:complete len:393 (-),score=66.81 gnl/TRDRNA2_/TRDRNA2_165691_c0_seq1:13-1131(-)